MQIKMPSLPDNVRPSGAVIKYDPNTQNVYIERTNGEKLIEFVKDAGLRFAKNQMSRGLRNLVQPMFNSEYRGEFSSNPPRVIYLSGKRSDDGGNDNSERIPSAPRNEPNKVRSDKSRNNKGRSSYRSEGRYKSNSSFINLPAFKVDGLNPSTMSTTPLYMINGSLFPYEIRKKDGLRVSIKNSFFNEFLSDIIYNYETKVQSTQTYDIGRVFNASTIHDYIHIVTDSLQLFFLIDSIVGYCEENPFGCRGMKHMRRRIGAESLELHRELGNMLQSCYLKPSCVEFIRNMYKNYSTNRSHNSPIIRLGFRHTFTQDEQNENLFSNDLLRAYKEDLFSLAQMNAYFQRMEPRWKIVLNKSKYSKEYDTDFLAFWHNSDITYMKTENHGPVVNHANIVSDEDRSIYFGAFADTVKTQHMSCCSYFDMKRMLSQPGLFMPSSNFNDKWENDNRTSLTCYYEEKIKGLKTPRHAGSSFIHCTPFKSDVTNQWEVSFANYQTKEAVGLNLTSFRRGTKDTVKYLFSLGE